MTTKESLSDAIDRLGVYKTSDGKMFLGEKKALEHDTARYFRAWYYSDEENQIPEIGAAEIGKWLDKHEASIYRYFLMRSGKEKNNDSFKD